ncbi:DUF3168 domain-containing protein [Streptomyces sp. WMMC897]|uniref:DUF3168 domain-containing protein n=1 Tax=Streptomyces sp. WMMC897 TaxID=3014782 RepID=UPI0022B74FDF|nr:DUF3168 domain-containing protein [Streptomyces sp. WMMC897]MCZ7414316.1 DUF3168 domain-containing protein [Streptomyces sp. WMMC897]
MSAVPRLAAEPIQRALYQLLTGDAVLMDLITAVVDYPPEDQPYPFLQLGDAVETPDNAHDRHGSQTVVTLHVWSQYRGYAQALGIAGRLVELLDHQPLTITGHRHVVTRLVQVLTLTDPEPPGDIRHVPVTFRVVTEVSN